MKGFNRVGVVGAGTIGAGVAQLLAEKGVSVLLVDQSRESLERATMTIRAGLRAFRMLGATSGVGSVDEIDARISTATEFDELSAVDFVVENVPERLDTKFRVYRVLDRVCAQECIIAANTSAMSIAELASATGREDRVIGLHFMNPPSLKPLVELIPAQKTSAETVAATQRLLQRLGKRWVVVGDAPGFVTNRLLMALINDAARVVGDGVAPAEAVDEIFRECFGHKMGPFETADLIGIDTIVLTLQRLQAATGEKRYRPHALLLQLNKDGHLGRKSGRGFHTYPGVTNA